MKWLLLFSYLLVLVFFLMFPQNKSLNSIKPKQVNNTEYELPVQISPTSNINENQVKIATPIPQPSLIPTTNPKNYELTPCQNNEPGCYSIKNAPLEPMSTPEELNQAVNTYRSTHNRNVLLIDQQVCNLAQQRAIEISTDFSHNGFQNHIDAGDYKFTGFKAIGENLWRGKFTGVHIIEFGWDKSPGHRENLLADWTRGCGGVYDDYAAFIFVK